MVPSFWKKISLAAISLILASLTSAKLPDGRPHANMMRRPAPPRVVVPDGLPSTDKAGAPLPPITTVYYFDQLIDHNNPSLGTFQQRYYHTWAAYETGGPIILFTPGEIAFDGYEGYLTNATVNGQIAQQENGATVVLEHRFYGLSNPYNNLSVASFRVHTLEQAVEDLVYFAKNVKLPMPGGDAVAPGEAPWILIGGSYSGALTSWTLVNQPGIFWAGYASSAVVEAYTDFWAYFEPIRLYMAPNCSADVQAVVAHFDSIFTSGNEREINALKAQFGMSDVDHLDDASGALRNNLWDWQSLQPDSDGGEFFTFCDALEVKDGVNAPASGWGLEHALEAWGSFFSTTYFPLICGNQTANDCLGTYDSSQSFWTDITINDADRSWTWIVCNQVGFYQESAPAGYPSLVSRLIQPSYDERQCTYWFPEAFSSPPVPTVDQTNSVYEGWDVKLDRIFFANGQRDPWRYVTVSSGFHNVTSTTSMPIAIGNGYHCSDLITASGQADATVAQVQKEALAYFREWMPLWKPSNATKKAAAAILRGATASTGSSVTAPVAAPVVSPGAKPVNAWYRVPGQF